MKITKKRLFDFCNENNDALNELQLQSDSTDFVLSTLIEQLKDLGVIDKLGDEKNSLIERDNVELTGNDLCRAMLERGDKVVLCAVSDDGDFIDGVYDAIHSVDEDGMFESFCSFWWYVQPVNNQGEPLTQSDVDL